MEKISRKRIIRVVSASAIIVVTLMFGIAVSSTEEVVKADTQKASVQPLVIETVEKNVEPQDTVTETVEIDEPEEVTVETEEEPYITIYYTEQDVIDIAKVLYNECRGVGSKTEQACVAWTILNRVDNQGLSISEVIRAKNQFAFNGDFKQCDAEVFRQNSGLMVAVDKLKGHPRFGYVKLLKTERSETAAMADLLD